MKNNIIRFLTFSYLIVVFGCADKTDAISAEISNEEITTSTTEEKVDEIIERKLIKEGNITFQVNDISTTRKNIFEAIKKHKGYIALDQEFSSSGRKNNTLIIRVPSLQ